MIRRSPQNNSMQRMGLRAAADAERQANTMASRCGTDTWALCRMPPEKSLRPTAFAGG